MKLGYILISFICTTPANAPVDTHDCLISYHGHYVSAQSCMSMAIRLEEDVKDAGGRVVDGVCRTPVFSDGDVYDLAIQKMNAL